MTGEGLRYHLYVAGPELSQPIGSRETLPGGVTSTESGAVVTAISKHGAGGAAPQAASTDV